MKISPESMTTLQRLEDDSVVFISIPVNTEQSWSAISDSCIGIVEHIKEKQGKNIAVFPFPAGSKAEVVRLQQYDILALQLDTKDEIVLRTAVRTMKSIIDKMNFAGTVGVVAINTGAGLNGISLISDDVLAQLGLVKISRLVEGGFTADDLAKAGLEYGDDLPVIFSTPEDSGDAEKTEIRYILHPSPNIDAKALAALYGVDVRECVSVNDVLSTNLDTDQYFHLYPRLDGRYVMPSRRGK